jgi:quinol monooxygenase YgiN
MKLVCFLYEIHDDRESADAHWASEHFREHAFYATVG